MEHFWSLNVPDDGSAPAELRLEGEIASETWFGDEVTPRAFREELARAAGRDIVVTINSPGGDVFAASEIYTALCEHKGDITVKVSALAASAASVVAMAGDHVLMAPTAYLMLHNPWTGVYGNAEDLRHEADVLDEIAEGIINAYARKSGMSRGKIRQLMDDETWLSARAAIDYGLADGMIERAGAQEAQTAEDMQHARVYASAAAGRRMLQAIACAPAGDKPKAATEKERDALLIRLREAKKHMNR